jgi:glutamate-ammonia-ligase adenylyltransferase
LLVTPLAAFADYQDTRAWTWEHQALVRARVVAGDSTLGAALEALRTRVLARPRDRATLLTEVARMRERWRKELDRSDSTRIDLKQGRGALVDLEFLLQAEVLAFGAAADRAWPTRTPELLQALAETGCLGADEAEALRAAHSQLLTRALDCSVDGAQRVVARDAAIERALASISAASCAHGFTTSE